MQRSLLNFLLLLLFSKTGFTATGAFFNVASSGTSVTITTTVPNHTYPNAGIKIDSSGYSLSGGCASYNNGYCLFSVSNTSPKTLTISGPSTKKLDITLCLNGKGPLTCQNYSVRENFAYIVSQNNNIIFLCSVNSNTGMLSNCINSGASNLSTPVDIVLNPLGTFAYITNAGNDTVVKCTINPNTKGLSGCAATPTDGSESNLGEPIGITLNSTGTIAYTTNAQANAVFCTINSNTGTLNNCQPTGSNVYAPFGISLNSTNTLAYIGNFQNAGITVCSINQTTGALNSCLFEPVGDGFITAIIGATLNSANTLAYISASAAPGFILLSTINPQTGSLGPAQPTAGPFNNNTLITLNLPETLIYIPITGDNSVSICMVTPKTGVLSGCIDSGVGGIFGSPTSIALIR